MTYFCHRSRTASSPWLQQWLCQVAQQAKNRLITTYHFHLLIPTIIVNCKNGVTHTTRWSLYQLLTLLYPFCFMKMLPNKQPKYCNQITRLREQVITFLFTWSSSWFLLSNKETFTYCWTKALTQLTILIPVAKPFSNRIAVIVFTTANLCEPSFSTIV